MVLNLIKETINESDEVVRWVNQKYGTIRIVREYY